VVDAVRPAMYSAETLRAAEGGYESRMRQYFIEQAQRRGFTVLDLQPVFMRRHEQDGARFEFPTDGHWNELGHRVVAEEIRNTPLFARLFPIEGAH
jgi:acetyltransferase AlgX (SGNH hydrolase-like protein)